MQFTIPDEHLTQHFETMTGSLAQQILDTEAYIHQRKRDKSYVNEYVLIMRRGEFRPGTEIVFARYKGKRHLINGQHTLAAIALCGIPLRVSVLIYDVEEEWMIHALYLTFDRNRLRSFDQLYQAHNLGQRFNLNQTQIRVLGSAMPLLITGFQSIDTFRQHYKGLLHSGPIRMQLMESFVNEMSWYSELIHGCPKEMSGCVRRASVVALALVTLRFTGDDAARFWHNVAFDDGLATNDPQKKVHHFLRETSADEHHTYIYVRYLISGWNIAFHNRALSKLPALDDKLPVQIDGTPHTAHAVLHYVLPNGNTVEEPQPWPDA